MAAPALDSIEVSKIRDATFRVHSCGCQLLSLSGLTEGMRRLEVMLENSVLIISKKMPNFSLKCIFPQTFWHSSDNKNRKNKHVLEDVFPILADKRQYKRFSKFFPKKHSEKMYSKLLKTRRQVDRPRKYVVNSYEVNHEYVDRMDQKNLLSVRVPAYYSHANV